MKKMNEIENILRDIQTNIDETKSCLKILQMSLHSDDGQPEYIDIEHCVDATIKKIEKASDDFDEIVDEIIDDIYSN